MKRLTALRGRAYGAAAAAVVPFGCAANGRVTSSYCFSLQQKYKDRFKGGFRPTRSGRRGDVQVVAPKSTLFSRFSEVFDTTISLVGLINEGLPYAAMAVW